MTNPKACLFGCTVRYALATINFDKISLSSIVYPPKLRRVVANFSSKFHEENCVTYNVTGRRPMTTSHKSLVKSSPL